MDCDPFLSQVACGDDFIIAIENITKTESGAKSWGIAVADLPVFLVRILVAVDCKSH